MQDSMSMPQMVNSKIKFQHDYLHDQIEAINRAIRSKIPHENLLQLVQDTEKSLASHFLTEENLMRDINYPKFKLDLHKAAHSEALLGCRKLLSDLALNNCRSKKVFEFLFDWTHVHELTEDRELSRYLDNYLKSDRPQ